MTGTIDWRARIVERLTGTLPSHGAEHLRIAGVTPAYSHIFQALFPGKPKPAAVLIPIVERQPEATILLTVRAAGMRSHAGQIAFPGGRIEATDADPAAAALREAWEEIGLPPERSRVVGYLADHLVFTGFQVTPVVALVQPGFTLAIDSGEVAEAFEVPLSHVLDPLNHRSRTRRMREHDIEVHDIPFGERNIWGATAGILVALYESVREP